MSVEHLAAGSQCPPKQKNKLRLYQMAFCPFSQRVRMVLVTKNIPFDVVNINLKNKPDWLFEINTEGKVPALDTGDEIITDSVGICEYLESAYPQPQLYPQDDSLKAKDKQLIENFNTVLKPFFAAIYNKDNKTLQEYMDEILQQMDHYEQELAARGSLYFGGSEPGMVDLLIWPWSERSKVPNILFNEEFSFPKERFTKLVEWRNAMKGIKAVKENMISPERHAKLVAMNIKADKDNTPVDYDSV